jgi:hypothetical protein
MNDALVDGIVKAILYEGYMLYPYRPSAVKNRQRFNFGLVYPQAYSEAHGNTEPWAMQTECLVKGNAETRATVRIRFLRLVNRSIRKLGDGGGMQEVDRLEVSGQVFQPWREAAEETIEPTEFNVLALLSGSTRWPFRLSATAEKEDIRDQCGSRAGIVVREKKCISGEIELAAKQLDQEVFKITVRIANTSRLACPEALGRDEALAQSLVSAHTMLTVLQGEFVSLIDFPEIYRDFVGACQNVGTWPVLVGDTGQRDTMLSSPIILYDYPQIAPESPGDLFDGAEIDEILSLRIMTMTDEEKREMRHSDQRARRILERTETLPEEQLMKLHGALRGLRTVKDETT